MLRKLTTLTAAAVLAAGAALAGSAPASAYTVTECIQGNGYVIVYVKHNWFEKVALHKYDGYQIRYNQRCA